MHPQWRGRGIGRRILQRYLERAGELRTEAAADEWDMHLHAADSDESAARLLRRYDFEPVRYWFEMERPTDGDIPDAPVAEGLRIRPYEPAYARALHTAHTEAFLDHWGSQARPRRQGVASALMARALHAYREAGVRTAGLDVDSVNPTGAVGVYERMGFRSVRRTVTYAHTV